MNALEIKNLTVDYGKFKLDGVNLGIKKGCITGLIGRNGSGKSTLIKAIMRQVDATGEILYDGKRFSNDEEGMSKRVACVFDRPFFSTRVKASRVAGYYKCAYENFDEERYKQLMARFELPENQRIYRYSFGMQRKFCLVLELCRNPEVLILDEPTAGVDPFDRQAVISLIQEFMMDENHTVLFSTHITEDLDAVADYIVMLEKGKKTLDSEKNGLLESYRLVHCPEMTPQLEKIAINPIKSAFGYSFLTTDKEISGENLNVKTPTVEELFLGFIGDGSAPDDVFGGGRQ